MLAVDLGIPLAGGRPVRTPAIRIHVAEKLDGARLPPARRFPRRIDGVRVDVLVTAMRPTTCPSAGAPLRKFLDPILGGASIAPKGVAEQATLACLVSDAQQTPLLLTAAHAVGPIGGEVLVQPAGRTTAKYRLGRVRRRVLDSRMDAATAEVGARAHAPGVWSLVGSITGVLDPIPDESLPLSVVLVGACSGRSEGLVLSKTFSFPIDYEEGVITMREQLHVKASQGEISRGGDSGALLLEKGTLRAVGLVFAGEAAGEPDFAMATPIRRVLTELGVSLA